MHKLISILLIICLFFCLFTPISYCNNSSFVWSNESLITSVSNNLEKTDLKLESPSAILIEQNTGKILYEQNAHEQLRPASVTKIMSILLIMEALDLR